MRPFQTKPYMLNNEDGQFFLSLGALVFVKATSEQTGGLFNLFEIPCPPDYSTLLHIHYTEDVAVYILGAAIYNAKWHPAAHHFLSEHQETLRQRPVAIFALGSLSTGDAAIRRSRRQLEKELERYPWLEPVALEMFVGKLDPSKLGFFERLGSTAIDHRDWEAIRAWANALPAQLQHDEMLSPA